MQQLCDRVLPVTVAAAADNADIPGRAKFVRVDLGVSAGNFDISRV